MAEAPPPVPTEEEEIDETEAAPPEGVELEEAAPAGDAGPKQFPCKRCGADITFKPGTASLVCPYCDTANEIPQADGEVVEQDFHAILAGLADQADTQEQQVVACDSCGAQVDQPEHKEAFSCPFCDSPIVAAPTSSARIRPESLLPFKVEASEAREHFRDWVGSLWFAPNRLKQYARLDSKLRGVYVPFWTYDCNTITSYTGQRGEDYYVTETYRDSEGNTKTRRKRKTRWYRVRGTVFNSFDDLLVLASRSLPKEHAQKLEPWDLGNLTPYQKEYLSGFEAETYQVDLEQGWGEACSMMQGPIRTSIERDIGGDRQRIHSTHSEYNNITFKHLLLPVWISAYRYQQDLYRVLVNARTGEVQGERPYSWIKIALAVIAALIVIGIIVAVVMSASGGGGGGGGGPTMRFSPGMLWQISSQLAGWITLL